MNRTTHDTAATLMALDNFENYAAAKIEVYRDALYEMGHTPFAPMRRPDLDDERIDAWKALIRAGDDHYPGDAIGEGWKALADQRRAARKAHARKTGVFPKRDPLGGSTT